MLPYYRTPPPRPAIPATAPTAEPAEPRSTFEAIAAAATPAPDVRCSSAPRRGLTHLRYWDLTADPLCESPSKRPLDLEDIAKADDQTI